MSLISQATSGVKWTSFSTLMRAIIQLVLLSISAHYLTPAQIGLYAVVQLVLGFCQLFLDLGLGNAIIHQQNVKQHHLVSLFLINLIFSLFISMMVYFSAPIIAQFFKQPQIIPLIATISPSFIIVALYRIHLVMLQKALAFNQIAKAEIFAQIVIFTVSVTAMLLGHGVMSLIWGYLSGIICQALFYWHWSSFRFTRTRFASYRELKKYLGFGLFQTGDAFINYINSQFDLIIVGKLLGAEALGGYSLARQFCFRPASVINPVLTRVAFPVMAKLQHSKQLSTIYCQLSKFLAAINFPLYLAMAIFAKPIVLLFFGEQWLTIVPLFQLMAIWCLVRSVMNPVGSLLMAIGQVKRLFKWNICILFVFPATLIFSAQFSITMMVYALIGLQCTLLILHWYFLLYKSAQIKASNYFSALFVPLIAAVIAGICAKLFSYVIPNNTLDWLFALGLGILIYSILMLKLSPEIYQLLRGKYQFNNATDA